MKSRFLRLKYGCYTAGLSMAIVAYLSPLLFITFREQYGLSYTQLGLLVVINFCTQLLADLAISFFPQFFKIPKITRATQSMTLVGFIIYALWPAFFPDMAYVGLALGTVLFCAGTGFTEVLTTPIISAAFPENADREVSKLHSMYAWGVTGMTLIFTGYLWLFGAENWQWMVGVLCLVPLTSYILYRGAEFPEMDTGDATQERSSNKGLWKCVLMIFMAGAVECTMAQWSSGYLEQALGIPKLWGDIFGVAMFSLFLGIGRTTYARKGGDIYPVLIWGTAGAAVCYLVAAVTSVPLVALLACVITGLCVSMLWPGSLIAATDRFPKAGMLLFALMAAGGDMGASLGSQLVGSVTDILMTQESFGTFAASQGVTPEQLAMKTAMLIGLLFALCALPVLLHMRKEARKP